jgi:hypothetical protein
MKPKSPEEAVGIAVAGFILGVLVAAILLLPLKLVLAITVIILGVLLLLSGREYYKADE